MPALLSQPAVSEAQRRANDRHRHAIVVATLAALCLYIYLFTPAASHLGIPAPQQLSSQLGLDLPGIFRDDGRVDTELSVAYAGIHTDDTKLLVLLFVITGAFLSAYYLPLHLKQGSLALWSLAGITLLYSFRAAAALLLAHLVVYLVFHPGRRRGIWLGAIAGLCGYWAFSPESGMGDLPWWPVIAMPLLAIVVYRYAVLPLLDHQQIADLLRAAVIHSAILAICLGLLGEALDGRDLFVPLGALLFFSQWARLALYHADFRDERVPHDLSLDRYLAVFLSPGVLPNWGWAVTIPLGYDYINARFLCRDKNRIVIAGLQILGIALIYLVLWNWLTGLLIDTFTRHGIEVYKASIQVMTYRFSLGEDVSTASVLLTTMLDLAVYILVFAGIAHIKVGIWRICGYDIEPYFNKPWLATNLMAFWTRFAYYYREFLLRVFYYPVFFRFRKWHPDLRIMLASLAAAGLGNLIWHLIEANLVSGIAVDSISGTLVTWPYFFLLGLGIGVSLIIMRRRRRRRRPWTLDRWFAADLLATYVTIQYFALIHVFARPSPASTVQDQFFLFMLGLGIDLR